MNVVLNKLSLILMLVTWTGFSFAQEHEAALPTASFLQNYHRPNNELRARTELTLPFFEDFVSDAYYPSLDHWQDSMVFVNNNLGQRNKSYGVATFDAFDAKGLAYSPNSPYATVYADSLTSQYFDLSTYSPSDSIYLSFMYEGGGFGYAPQLGDSLMLFMQNSLGFWKKVWSQKGTSMSDFSSANIPITDTSFLHSDFRFRLINKATYGVGNSNWHVDYIKLAANRTLGDTVYSDLTMTYWGDNNNFRSLLNDYTSMPYNHFNADRNRYYNGQLAVSMRNNWYTPLSADVSLRAHNAQTNTTNLISGGTTYFQASDNQIANFTVNNSLIDANSSGPLSIDMTAYFDAPIAGDYSQGNDSIKFSQVFDNYFAYDDGSAESGFFMTSYPGVPSYVAQEYFMQVPDTLRGVNIYFPRQVPDASNKLFYLQIYKSIDATGAANQMIYQQSDLYPNYDAQANGFITYAFSQSLAMDSGTYYVALMFPAGGFSDSLYIGLDKGKTGANFRYFNVAGNWEPSLIDGALMIRPLVGAALPLSVTRKDEMQLGFEVYPNPVNDRLYINVKDGYHLKYSISNALGSIIAQGDLKQSSLDFAPYMPGIYYLSLMDEKGNSSIRKIIKIAK